MLVMLWIFLTPPSAYNMKATYMNISVDRTFPQQVMLPATAPRNTTTQATMWEISQCLKTHPVVCLSDKPEN